MRNRALRGLRLACHDNRARSFGMIKPHALIVSVPGAFFLRQIAPGKKRRLPKSSRRLPQSHAPRLHSREGYLLFGQTALAFPPALLHPRRLVQRFLRCELSVRCPRIRHSPNVRQTRWHRASGTAGRFGLAETIGKVDQAKSVELAAMTICSGGDRCFSDVQTGRWITRGADGSGGSSAPRPARPAQQHPLQPTENSEKAKPAFPPTNQRGVVLPTGPPRVAAAASKSSAARKNH